MQHHGAPTRLLDWTLSPYVAAYFAARQDGANRPGAVWCFCAKTLQQSFEANHKPLSAFEETRAVKWYTSNLKKLRKEALVVPLDFNYSSSERMAAQQGRFTMCFKLQQKHDCIIGQIGQDYLKKLLIPHESKPDFLLRLRDMNITASALFPGVDGLGHSVRELVSLGVHYKTVARAEASRPLKRS